MPPLAESFAASCERAQDFATAVEVARTRLGSPVGRQVLDIYKLELAYELAYLRVFTAWESFLEESFLRYMCGYSADHGQEQLTAGRVYSSNLSSARETLYQGRRYMLWHNPGGVINRATTYFSHSKHELVLASMQGRIEHYASIRHRVAHAGGQIKFDLATMALAGRRYRASRPGRFLRCPVPHSPNPMRWIDQIVLDFRGLAFQIVPC